MMVDNFTYTIFKFGAVTTGGIWRGIYAFILIVIFMEVFIKLYKSLDIQETKETNPISKTLTLVMVSLLIFSAIIAFSFPKYFGNDAIIEEGKISQLETNLPNIILLGSDGLNAQNMSVYGYERDTTPRIKELAGFSKLAENAFPNAGNSAGSVISILTGKLPTQTRLAYPPDILKGRMLINTCLEFYVAKVIKILKSPFHIMLMLLR